MEVESQSYEGAISKRCCLLYTVDALTVALLCMKDVASLLKFAYMYTLIFFSSLNLLHISDIIIMFWWVYRKLFIFLF